MKRLLILILLLAPAAILPLVAGCDSDDETPNGPSASIDGLSLMGLISDHSLEYFQIDTTVTLDPLETTVETTIETLTVSGAGEDWIIYDNSDRLMNLKVSQSYLLQNGYWYKDGLTDDLAYFPTPAILMRRDLSDSPTWETYIPPYVVDSVSQTFPRFFTYFGFQVRKYYVGIEEVLVPAGAYDAHRFDVELYANINDSTPIATSVEYYAPSIGMVKQKIEARPTFVRTLNLIRSE